MKEIIQINNVTKSFKDQAVLNNLSLNIYEGEMVALVGPSGCGKSTLLNIIGVLDNDYSGEVLIDNELVNQSKKYSIKLRKERLGYLFQNFALLDDHTVKKNLEIVSTDKKKMLRTLKLLGLEDKLNSKVYTLSGGEQQRVALVRLLLKNPDIILADEPTGSLDINNEKLVLDLLLELKRQGKTIVVVTHEKEILSYFDRVIELK